jgi:ribonuclease D
MAELFTKKYKLANPYKPDEKITQEVVVSDEPTFDYEDSPWLAIDTEFLDLKLAYSKLCVVQIASPHPDDLQRIRVEVIWVWEKIKSGEMKALNRTFEQILSDEKKQLIMHVSTADLPRIQTLANNQPLKGKLFDTKVAGKIVITNSRSHGMDDMISSLIDPSFQKDKKITATQWDLHPQMWPDKAVEYAMGDVLYLHPLMLQLEEMAERRDQAELLQETMKIMPQVCNLYNSGYDVSVLTY